MAASRARVRLVLFPKWALCEMARTRTCPRWTKPRLTRSHASRVASAVTNAVAAAWTRGFEGVASNSSTAGACPCGAVCRCLLLPLQEQCEPGRTPL